MLASYLRRMLFLNSAFALLLAGWGVAYAHWPWWLCLALPVVWPFGTTAISILASTLQSRASGVPWGTWWASVWGEYRASVHFFLLRQPWAGPAPGLLAASAVQTTRLRKPPIVLVHGYVCNHRMWDTMGAELRAQGHSVIAVDLEPVFTSIEDYAPTIEAAVQTALIADAANPNPGSGKVVLIGHSMGGLAIRAWMRAQGEADTLARVAQVITLGTPHAGTRLGTPKLAITPNSAQMVWQSDYVKTLEKQEPASVRSLLRIAVTAQDNIVFPQLAQTVHGIVPTVFTGIGHLQMCRHQAVTEWVLAHLMQLAVPQPVNAEVWHKA
ncbi:esterase/lipase family protein [Rhodoferax aquaticus]|uniref:Alpha/beta fold hydrolase n=1 Tax=Rhodoferax aquaticus TaxID=2527691 RepID=A0A515EPV1_9BURK|nr:alpha/beta fold hydrolase [Rhodoferax aquaticus]QDL54704.1 alpha/beta fold hydrolase [Rhodoferax aquaticus]